MERMVWNALSHRASSSTRAPNRADAWRFVAPVLLLAAFFFLAVGLQNLAGAYGVELSGYPDESGHFVTGVLIQEYITKIPPPAAVPFAREFYIHRPKVAIGHWPPILYLIEGIWFSLFHASRHSVLALMALISASLAASICHVVRQRQGTPAGIASGVLFICLSLVQTQTSEVMADMLVALFGFWATLSFADFLSRERAPDILRFAAFALLAIFAKNNGLYLALIPPICLLLTREYRVLRSPLLWLGAAIVGIPSAVWVAWGHKYVANTWVETPGLSFFLRASRIDLWLLYVVLGPLLLILAAVGAVREFIQFDARRGFVPQALTSAVLSVLLFQSLAPAGIESRFLLPAVATMIPLLFSGLMWLSEWVGPRAVPLTIRAGALLTVAVLIPPHKTFAIPHKPYRGFSEVADFIQADPSLRRGAILVSSSSDGEGLLISEVVMRYPSSQGFVLRASKMLAQSDWLGRDYISRFRSADEVFEYMKKMRTDLLVIDDQAGIPERKHQELLLQMCSEHPDYWQAVGIFPTRRPPDPTGSKIFVYRRIGSSGPPGEEIHQEMEEILRRMIGE
jgi:hypothetical protein